METKEISIYNYDDGWHSVPIDEVDYHDIMTTKTELEHLVYQGERYIWKDDIQELIDFTKEKFNKTIKI